MCLVEPFRYTSIASSMVSGKLFRSVMLTIRMLLGDSQLPVAFRDTSRGYFAIKCFSMLFSKIVYVEVRVDTIITVEATTAIENNAKIIMFDTAFKD